MVVKFLFTIVKSVIDTLKSNKKSLEVNIYMHTSRDSFFIG